MILIQKKNTRLIKHFVVLISFILLNISLQAQTMTFDADVSEAGFSFNNWSWWSAPLGIYSSNLASPSNITKDAGTFTPTSFDVTDADGVTQITVSSNKGGSVVFTNIGPVNLGGANFTDITTLTFTRTAGAGIAPTIDNLAYTVGSPEMDIMGNGNSISDGDNTPSTTDHTDFGETDVSAGSVVRTYTIANNGTANLNLTDASPYITIGGSHAGDFLITQNPATPVAPGGGTTTFNVTFNPSNSGTRLASISIANNDGDENPYNFSIQGTGTATPTITSATYNYFTNIITVTGENFEAKVGATNDVDVSKLTITGEGGATYTLVSSPDAELTNSTTFIVVLSGSDIFNVESLLNKNGIASATSGTTYNLAAADDWLTNVIAGDISDATNGITVSNFENPSITSVVYDYSTNTLVATGTNFVNKSGVTNDVDISLLTFTGEGGATYTLTSANDVEIISATQFSITLSGSDVTNVEGLLNKDGTTSSISGTTYNLAAADNWMAGSFDGNNIADASNIITVSNYAVPNIVSAVYNFNTNVMTVTGTNFVSNSSGADVDVSKFQIDNGNGMSTMTVYSTDVEVTSATEFSFTISGDDLPRSEYIMDKNGTKCVAGTDYNFIANDNWMTATPSTPNISDYPNGLTVTNYSVPVITSVTYNYNTNVLTFTGTDFINNPFVQNDVDVSDLTITGEGGSTYTFVSTGDVEVLSGTTFSISLSGSDIPNLEALLNKDGTSSDDNTTYNLAAAEDWMISVPSVNNCADATSGITVSNYASPGITSATYNWNTGVLVLTGTNFVVNSGANNDIDVSMLKIGGEGANEYTLTNTSDVDITSATSASLTLSSTDKLNVNGLLNKNGNTSGDLTPYNLAAADNWMSGSPSSNNIADGTATISVSNVSTPTITSATFNYLNAQFVVTATNLAHKPGVTNDIDVSKLTITGEGGSTYTITETSDVEVTSTSEFTITLSGSDIYNVKALLNKDGISSSDNWIFNISAADDWMTASDANANIADLTNNGITVSNYTAPTFTSATYDFNTGQFVVTGENFVNNSGAVNDIDASLLTIVGEGGSYTFTNTSDVELTSGTEFTLTLSSDDKLNVNGFLNKNGAQSSGGITYNIAAAEDWMTGSPSAIAIADLTGNGITVSNVSSPTITNASYNSDTGAFLVTCTNLFKKPGANNDIDVSKLTITGEGGNYTISDAITDIEITSETQFSFSVNGTNKTQVDSKLDQLGTQSSGGTVYNIAAADDWLTASDPATDISDIAANGISVFIPPTISSANYNTATGVLVVTGSNIQANGGGSDIDASKFTITGEGGETYTLTNTANVERTNISSFTLTLSAADKNGVNQILNKNGGTSTSGTNYNIAAADDWCTNVTDGNTEDLTANGITAANVPVPSISSATFDISTGLLSVTGNGFVKKAGPANDIDITKFIVAGEGGETISITNTTDVEITSSTNFSVVLSGQDKTNLVIIINKNGTTSTSGTNYNLAAAEDWMPGTDPTISVADINGNTITANNVAVPVITSSSYHWSNGLLTATGVGFTKKTGITNDIDASKFTFTGEGGASYTLTGTLDVEINSYTEFTLTLDETDKAFVNNLINKEGTQAEDNTLYNLAAAEDWALGADAAVNIIDATTSITAGNFNNPPTGSNNAVTINEDIPFYFSINKFTFNDIDGDNFAGIKIESVETLGDLEYNGTDVVVGQDCPDVTLLKFLSLTDQHNSPYTTFTFKVIDDRGGYSDESYQYTINVNSVNDAPSFTASNPPVIFEDSGEQIISNWAVFNAGVNNERASQDVEKYFISNISNPELFEIIPSVDLTGTLTYKAASNANGSSTFGIMVKDNGGTANGGIDSSQIQTFDIIVNAINDAPSFTASNPPVILEDSGEQIILNFAEFNPGPEDEDSSQTVLNYTINNITNSELFINQPVVSSDGTLTYKTAENANGTAIVEITVTDNGGTLNGGNDTSEKQEFTITVNSVNDAPDFTATNPLAILEDAGKQTITNWASFDAGPEDEDTLQAVKEYKISNINNIEIFEEYPVVDNNGTLTYKVMKDKSGTSTFDVLVKDNGGTDYGGIDSSSVKTFTISVSNTNDAPIVGNIPNINVDEDSENTTLDLSQYFSDADQESKSLKYSIKRISNPDLLDSVFVKDYYLVVDYSNNKNGTTYIQIEAVDNMGQFVETTLMIKVNSINDAPFALGIEDISLDEDAENTIIDLSKHFSDVDQYSETLEFNIENISNSDLFSSVTINGNNLVIDYSDGKYGTANITIKATDNKGLSSNTTFTVIVKAVNDAPKFTSIPVLEINEDESFVIAYSYLYDFVLDDETESSKISYQIMPSTYIKEIYSDSDSIIFKPVDNWYGVDTLSLLINDGELSALGPIIVKVVSVNDAPVISVLPRFSIDEDNPLTINISSLYEFVSDDELEDLELNFEISSSDNLEYFSISNDSIVFQPKNNWFGVDTLILSVNDGDLTTTADIYCTVNPVNDIPYFTDLPDTLRISGLDTLYLDVFKYIEDIEEKDEELTYSISTSSDTLSTIFNEENGELKLFMSFPYEGTIDVFFTVTDSEGGKVDTILALRSIILTGLQALEGDIPEKLILEQNYPNPFNPSTTIRYGIPEVSNVKIEIYNLLGETVMLLADDHKKAGFYEERFEASRLASGIYIYRIISKSARSGNIVTQSKKMLLIK